MKTPQTATAQAIAAYHNTWNLTSDYDLSRAAGKQAARSSVAGSELEHYADHYGTIAACLFSSMEDYEYQIDGTEEQDSYLATRRNLEQAIAHFEQNPEDDRAARAVIQLAQTAANVPEDDRISVTPAALEEQTAARTTGEKAYTATLDSADADPEESAFYAIRETHPTLSAATAQAIAGQITEDRNAAY